MLGTYNMRLSGVREEAQELLKTGKTIQDIIPAVKVAADDYLRISPAVNYVVDYWPTVLFSMAVVVGAGAAVGSVIGQKLNEKRKQN